MLPIASITKLMTGLVVTEAQLPLDETLTISQEDVDTEKGSRSRLRVGTATHAREMLHLALMSSENRAAHALGRQYPGGLDAFVSAMNAKARLLGMSDTHYVEPTGLSSRNQSSAKDLATLVNAAYEHQIIRELSTSPEYSVAVGKRELQFRTTNALVRNPTWEIGLQKTGYISEAGRCLVMQAKMAGRQLIMVFLDSAGSTFASRRCRARAPLGQRPSHVAPATTSSSAAALDRRRPDRRCGGGSAAVAERGGDLCRRRLTGAPSRIRLPAGRPGAEIDRPATRWPWSSRMPAAMQRTPSSSSSSSRAVPPLVDAVASSRSSAGSSVMLLRVCPANPVRAA